MSNFNRPPKQSFPPLKEIARAGEEYLNFNTFHAGTGAIINQGDKTGLEHKMEAEMNAVLLEIQYKNLCEEIGISFRQFGYCFPYEGSRNSEKTLATLMPLVTEPYLFKTWLESLGAVELNENWSLEKTICNVIDSYQFSCDVLYSNIDDLEKQTEESRDNLLIKLEGKLGEFAVLESELQRLGFANRPAFKIMIKRIEYCARGLLTDYMRAEKRQYLFDPENQKFGTAYWHTNNLKYRWEYAIDFYNNLLTDPTKKEFAREIKQEFLNSIGFSIDKIIDKPKITDEDIYNVENLLNIQKYFFDDINFSDEMFCDYAK